MSSRAKEHELFIQALIRPLAAKRGLGKMQGPRQTTQTNMAVCQNLVPLVNIKIAGKMDVHPSKNGINRY